MKNENGDLISRSALIKTIREDAWAYRVDWDFEGISGYIYTQEAVDAVEVIRCKDCRYAVVYGIKDKSGLEIVVCKKHSYSDYYVTTRETDFCSYGERRKENE